MDGQVEGRRRISRTLEPGLPGPSDKVLRELAVVGVVSMEVPEPGRGKDTGVFIHLPAWATCCFSRAHRQLGTCPGPPVRT